MKTKVLVVERVMIVEVVLIQVFIHFVCHDHDCETDRCALFEAQVHVLLKSQVHRNYKIPSTQ